MLPVSFVGALVAGAAVPKPATCPPPNIAPMSGFNTTEFVRATWFVQQQQVTEYLPRFQNFCVAQTLVLGDKKVPFFSGPVISVYNYAVNASVDGPVVNAANGTVLCARQTDRSDPAKIINAPCFLPNAFAGDYWVIAAGPQPYEYQWAIISAGQPTETYPDGCSTKLTGVNGAGLWLFHRMKVAPAAAIAEMRSLLASKGYALSQLNSVTQAGCTYPGAYIKG
eukprot:CAMPEP_0182921412 /NCGR_PEP_ID=MMETSP0105_2-20130417/4131_1 /TAXON_ID=81532 ORGANISM="Acanthoeca-like sp., Strain 10tr" /NCGR_SAMPLE_ID=MMETSP0105_2 /ASSEMBLY_ACC=CAM_ASM_000205 /LENGTH=223 /DNA_ID=CAMNT_0025058933 /DNA_START=41 /DNA_END=712 /DNA_ORIENTATION=-